jgi:ribosomal protein S27E
MSEKMHVICVECGNSIELDLVVYMDYKGLIRCSSCKSLLEIEVDGGELMKTPIVRKPGSKEK